MTTSRGRPDERKARLDLGIAHIECTLRLYKGEISSLVIVTPSTETLVDYLRHADAIVGLASGLFHIDARTMVWIEHRSEAGRDIFTRIHLDKPDAATQNEPPQRIALESQDLQHMLHTLGYAAALDERGNIV